MGFVFREAREDPSRKFCRSDVQLSAQRQLAECSMIDLEVWISSQTHSKAMGVLCSYKWGQIAEPPGIDQRLVLASFFGFAWDSFSFKPRVPGQFCFAQLSPLRKNKTASSLFWANFWAYIRLCRFCRPHFPSNKCFLPQPFATHHVRWCLEVPRATKKSILA